MWRTTDTDVALDVLKKQDVSAHIIALGWLYVTNQPPNFGATQNRWWDIHNPGYRLVFDGELQLAEAITSKVSLACLQDKEALRG